jgi:hypothetical protein
MPNQYFDNKSAEDSATVRNTALTSRLLFPWFDYGPAAWSMKSNSSASCHNTCVGQSLSG